MLGKIRNLVQDKGYGFIACAENRTDYFFHRSQCITEFEDLSINTMVRFEIDKSDKGPRARDVEVV